MDTATSIITTLGHVTVAGAGLCTAGLLALLAHHCRMARRDQCDYKLMLHVLDQPGDNTTQLNWLAKVLRERGEPPPPRWRR